MHRLMLLQRQWQLQKKLNKFHKNIFKIALPFNQIKKAADFNLKPAAFSVWNPNFYSEKIFSEKTQIVYPL